MRLATLVGAALAGLFLLAPAGGNAQDLRREIDAIVKDYLAAHPDQVGEAVRQYFAAHPEVLAAIVADALKRNAPAVATAPANAAPVAPRAVASRVPVGAQPAAVASNAPLLFSSPHQVTLGNPDGDITLVEFFDYSCGFCKRALPDMLTLLKDDPKLKIVLKEFPILGPGSTDAARVAVAVRMQDKDGSRYLAFHEALLGGAGPASKEKALAAAKDQGFDMVRLEQDMASDEVNATLAENTRLAAAVGIQGTPGYVIGNAVVPGAIGVTALQERIAAARGRTAN